LKERIEEYEDAEIWQVFEWIASDGLNRLDEEILAETRDVLGFARMGSRVRERLTRALGAWKARA